MSIDVGEIPIDNSNEPEEPEELEVPWATEEIDIYVWINSRTKLKAYDRHKICTFMDDDRNVDHDYGVEQPFFEPFSDRIRIRIPALMCFRQVGEEYMTPKDMLNEIIDYMLYDYRKQVGIHALLSQASGIVACPVRYANNYEDNNMNYFVHHNLPSFTSIYPCYRPTVWPNEFEMVFGLCFVPEQRVCRQRTWGRYNHIDVDNRFSFDITSSMFDKALKDEAEQGDHYTNTDLFHENRPGERKEGDLWSFAFYVCQGARAVLVDHRHEEVDKFKRPYHHENKRGPHCRSLCQQGSVIIVRGRNTYGIHLHYWEMDNGADQSQQKANTQQSNRYVDMYYYNFFNSDYVRPRTRTELDSQERMIDNIRIKRDNGQYLHLSELKDKVIFLGAADSQFNSVCWELNIAKDKKTNGDHLLIVKAPQGGSIVDIAPWRTGFQLIYWRQRYERLYKSVIDRFDGNDFDDNMEFLVPANEYMFKRIVGIHSDLRMREGIREGWYNNFEIVVPTHVRGVRRNWLTPNNLDDEDQDIRRYIPLHPECQNNLLMRNIEMLTELPNIPKCLPQFPLYPPYQICANRDEFCYLSNKEKVVSVADDEGRMGHLFEIVSTDLSVTPTVDPYQQFTLEVKEIDAPYWLQSVNNYVMDQRVHYRLGSDYQLYWKYHHLPDLVVHKVKTFCLVQYRNLGDITQAMITDPEPNISSGEMSDDSHENGQSSDESSRQSERRSSNDTQSHSNDSKTESKEKSSSSVFKRKSGK